MVLPLRVAIGGGYSSFGLSWRTSVKHSSTAGRDETHSGDDMKMMLRIIHKNFGQVKKINATVPIIGLGGNL